jgi:hypothetical protein
VDSPAPTLIIEAADPALVCSINAADVEYTVFTVPGQEPPITVDAATGRVQTVHIGHALIRMGFEGAKG